MDMGQQDYTGADHAGTSGQLPLYGRAIVAAHEHHTTAFFIFAFKRISSLSPQKAHKCLSFLNIISLLFRSLLVQFHM
ncbi:hypothetical protein BTJ40_21860 [Microbulbifer sp. A4B17]|nr:hypothetical protein BTJ40_21860 [Microbulbifer sp. A4B17]